MVRAEQRRRFRGRNKGSKWEKPDGGQVSVMVLPLAVTDPADLARLGKLFRSMWSVKRAVQRDARARIDAYWAAKHERGRGVGRRPCGSVSDCLVRAWSAARTSTSKPPGI